MVGVDVAGVSKGFGAVPVLDNVSAAFAPGMLTSLLGPSGSGKTTLLRIIAGFETPDRGSVRIGGETVTDTPVWRRQIGMVFQSYALFPHMTVLQNVLFGLHRRGVRGGAAVARARESLELVRLGGFEARRPAQLSGGQQQRVALARAIVTGPRVLLLDEPLSALDRRLRQEMQVELRRIQRTLNLTTIFVTHDQEEALTLSDTVAILDHGRIVQSGAPAEVYERPRSRFAASFLGDANFLAGTATADGVVVSGRLLSTADPLPPPGSAVTLAVRPEKIGLDTADSAADGNTLPAIVQQIIYAGAASTFLLAAEDGTLLRVFAQNRDVPAAALGQRVVLHWAPAHSVVVAA